jgi:hypothetical protein
MKLALALGLVLSLVSGPITAQAPPTAAPLKASGERLDVTIFNVSPQTSVAVALSGARLLEAAPSRPGMEAFAKGVKLQGDQIVFTPPPGSVPAGGAVTASFAVLIEISGPLQGTVLLAKPEVVLLETPRGNATLQGGAFRIATPSLPGNCVLAGCREGLTTCPKDARGTERTCQPFLSDWLCCVGEPVPIV